MFITDDKLPDDVVRNSLNLTLVTDRPPGLLQLQGAQSEIRSTEPQNEIFRILPPVPTSHPASGLANATAQ
jgi:hypothetical protein